MATTQKPATFVVTGKCRASYAHVWEPQQKTDKLGKPIGEPKYSIVFLIPKKDTKQLARIEAAIDAAVELGKTSKWKGKLPKGLKLPLNDGDEKYEEDEEKYAAYKGMMYFSASDKMKPRIIDTAGNEITERDGFYSGCYCKGSVNFYPFDNESKGIAAGLNNLLFVEDGENLGGGRTKAEDDFADDIDADDDL